MKKRHIKILTLLLMIVSCILIVPQCKKDKKDQIQNVYVDFSIDVTSTIYQGLNIIGGYVYVTGGVRGIIIYRKSADEFMAYERDCPYQPNNSCALIKVDNSALMAVDSCCGSKFLLLDGSVVNGPATRMLKYYNTSYDGVKMLHVYN